MIVLKIADSLFRKSLDSVKGKVEKAEVIAATQKAVEEIYKKAKDIFTDAEGDDAAVDKIQEGTELTVKNLSTEKSKKFKLKPPDFHNLPKISGTILVQGDDPIKSYKKNG